MTRAVASLSVFLLLACVKPVVKGPAGSENPCAAAQDNSYCGTSTSGEFAGTGDANTLYRCEGGETKSRVYCPAGCQIAPSGQADFCLSPPPVVCGAGDDNLSDNGWCGTDNRNYYCYQNVWHLKEDCQAEGKNCTHNTSGADYCSAAFSPPAAACGAGDNNGPDNGTCGSDNKNYFCYQDVWHLKEDCQAEGKNCTHNASGADYCSTPLSPPTAECTAGDNNLPDNGTCGPDQRNYYCYQDVWHLKEDCPAEGKTCIFHPGAADTCG